MAQRILIASVNPWAFCMAAEAHFARAYSANQVDAIDLFALCSRASPHWRKRDKLIETINRKIPRFVMSAINGDDITRHITVDRGRIPPIPQSYEALRAYTLDDAKLGLAVLSSVSSLTTIQYPATLAEYGPALEAAWRCAHVSLRVGQAVRDFGYDKVIIFNGRHCYSRPFCDVLEAGAEVIRYEQGSAGNRYVAAARSVHHPESLKQLVEAHQFDEAAGESFFRERMEKDPATEVGLFTAPQRAGSIPERLERGRAITFFTSSSDEMFAVTDDPLYGAFPTQNEIALALSEICREQGRQLVLRLHPHLRFKHPAWKREWNFPELERRGVLILGPEDPADSYAILQSSKAIVTTGSTIGLEASYLGVPNAVVGTWLGGCLGASMVARDAADLARFIANPSLSPDARQRALWFGSYYKRAGTLLPELDVGTHPNLARIDGRVVDPMRYAVQKLRFAIRPQVTDPGSLDLKSGLQAGRVILAPGTNYASALRQRAGQGKAATSGVTKLRRASVENSRSGE